MPDTETSPTCGAQYRALVATLFPLSSLDETELHALILQCPGKMYFGCFALGSMTGEASKVALGACHAFMIRPAPDWWDWSIEAMQLVCNHYGLLMHVDAAQGELWGVQPAAYPLLCHALRHPVQSPRWHVERGLLCGIAAEEIDPAYHLRDTFGVRCEPEGREG